MDFISIMTKIKALLKTAFLLFDLYCVKFFKNNNTVAVKKEQVLTLYFYYVEQK